MAGKPSVARAVAAALRAVTVRPEDAGAVALARRYAGLLDEAAPKARYVSALRRLRSYVDPGDEQAMAAYQTVADALAEHSVASDLGPKLLAVLTALGMTPGAKGGEAGGAAVAARLDEFTARRARKHQA